LIQYAVEKAGRDGCTNAAPALLYFTDAHHDEGGAPPNLDLRVLELAKSNRARRGEKIYLLWLDGRFIPVTPGAFEKSTNDAEADRLFMKLLATVNKQGMNISPNQSSNYGPTVLARLPAAKGIGKVALERAMFRLLEKGEIRAEPFCPPSKVRQRLVIEPNTS